MNNASATSMCTYYFNETCNSNENLSLIASPFSNSTNLQPTSVNPLKIIQSSGYVVSGLSAVIASLLIILLVATNRSLHTKDFYILAGLAGSDLIRGYGYFHGGIVRIMLTLQGVENVKISPPSCMLQIYQTFMIFGQKASPLVVMFLSIDRLLAVLLFQRYKRFGLLYAVCLVAIAYSMSAIVTVLAWITAIYSMPKGLMVAQTCKTESVTPNWFFCLETGMRFFPGFICMFVYVYALSIVKSKSAAMAKGMQESDRKKQSQLTKNVSVIMVIEFLFTTLPFGYSFISFAGHYTQSDFFNTISPFSWSLSLFGAAGNFFLYAFKYPKFRRALEKQILRKSEEQLMHIPNRTVFVAHTSKSRV